jgi:rhodanese-related sulfurtransferase
MRHSLIPLLVALIALSLSFACTKGPKPVGALSPMEAAGLVRNDFGVLVDVREAGARGGKSAAQAVLLPLSAIAVSGEDWKALTRSVPKDKEILVFGSTAEDARAGAEEFAREGYKASSIGTFDDWVKAGLPTQ